jgi:serine O-acetyltransferase
MDGGDQADNVLDSSTPPLGPAVMNPRSVKLMRRINGLGRALFRGIREAMVHPLILAYRASRQAEAIQADVAAWCGMRGIPGRGTESGNDVESGLRAFLAAVPDFRNVFYYRLSAGGGWPGAVGKIGRMVWRPLNSLEINCPSIGPGLVVVHGYGAVLTAERVGANCTIHQQVTVGWSDPTIIRHAADLRLAQNGRVKGPLRPPILGDNVFLGTGAKVLGEITVGNDVIVGANAVVIRDVPDGYTAVGVPARHLPRTRAFTNP